MIFVGIVLGKTVRGDSQTTLREKGYLTIKLD